MNDTYNQGRTSPRYVEIAPDGKVLHQSDFVPADVEATYLSSQRSMNFNSTYPNVPWSNYPYQTSNNQQWRLNNGQHNPYRTSYQDYGPNNPRALIGNAYYTQPNTYSQAYNKYGGNWNSFATTSYAGSKPPQYM